MWNSLSATQRRRLIVWVGGVVVAFLGVTVWGVLTIESDKVEQANYNAVLLDPREHAPDVTPPEPLSPDDKFVPVSVGMFVEGIEALSMKDSSWGVSFLLWFRWQGDPKLDPARTFRLTNGRTERRDTIEQRVEPDGTNYQLVRAFARVTKYFHTSRLPLGNHVLTIGIEDAAKDGTAVRYSLDQAESKVSSRVQLPGFILGHGKALVKRHTYETSLGHPESGPEAHRTFTQFIYGIPIRRSSMALYFKAMIGLFAAVTLGFSTLFVRPSDVGPRLALPSASFFGAIGNSYLISSTLPQASSYGLVDYVSLLSLFAIFVCLATSLASSYFALVKNEPDFSRALDRFTLVALGASFLVSNAVFPVSAYSVHGGWTGTLAAFSASEPPAVALGSGGSTTVEPSSSLAEGPAGDELSLR